MRGAAGRNALRHASLLLATLVLAGCGLFSHKTSAPVATTPPPPQAPAGQPRLKADGYSAYGNPASYEVFGQRYTVLKSSHGFIERGIASWYGPDFHGKLTSTREQYDMYQMTGAHKQLPLPTWVNVTNLENGRSVTLRVNDRGPFKHNRIIDLSYAAALKLDVVAKGTAFVEIRAVDQPDSELPRLPVSPGHPARMYLQIGAFGTRENADRLHDRAAPVLELPIRVLEDRSGGRRLYKVQVGPIQDVDHADAALDALARAGISGHVFVNH